MNGCNVGLDGEEVFLTILRHQSVSLIAFQRTYGVPSWQLEPYDEAVDVVYW